MTIKIFTCSNSPSSRLVEMHFPVQKIKFCFLFRAFFHVSRNDYLNYREAYLKLCHWQPFSLTFQILLSIEAVFPLVETSPNSPFLRVETNFLFSWKSILLFRDFFLLEEIGKSNLWKKTLFLLVKTDFLASGNLFFLPFSGTPATVSFIFPSHGNVFLNESWILISRNGFPD